MWTKIHVPWFPVHSGTSALSVHQIPSLSSSLHSVLPHSGMWKGSLFKYIFFSFSTSWILIILVPKFMLKRSVSHGERVPCLFIWLNQKYQRKWVLRGCCEVAKRVFGFRWITHNISNAFRLSIQTFGFLSTRIPNFIKLLKVYCG